MKATEAKFLDFVKKSPQFIIPIYQRTYSWTEKECRQLWDDILRAGNDDKISAHFVGSIVYIEKGLYQVTTQSPLLVIDGQQRLTTLTLLLAALAKALDKAADDKREPLDGFSAKKIRAYYLLNPEEEDNRHFKLLLSQTDRDTLIAIVNGAEQPKEHSIRIQQNFELFEKLLTSRNDDLSVICKGLAKLVVVDIALSRDQDNPQLIFESMNSTGKELSQADLIRNFVLMGLEPKLQERLYKDYWRPMEIEFRQENYSTQFDGFIRHYLTIKRGGEIPNQRETYEAFKKYAQSEEVAQAGVEALVKDIRQFARFYCAMALGGEQEPDLKRAFQDLQELKVDVAFPFLLELYQDYTGAALTKVDFLEAVRLVESYVFRRAVCSIPTNSLNKTFATLIRQVKKDRYLESIKAQFALIPPSSYRRFPGDEEFRRDLKTRDLYNFGQRRSYWLRRLENHGRKEWVPIEEYTIEHIMPQNEKLPEAWRRELGPEWQRVHGTWLHTIGNLTLTGYNSEYSDRPFAEKVMMKGGFSESPVRLNEDLRQATSWNEQAIKARAERLTGLAVTVWAPAILPEDVLNRYRPRPAATAYSINDHPYLNSGETRVLFEAFRRAVLALDPCVSEEFFKHYVAYKAETNFVDVVPQAKRLRLSLNMPFAEIEDSRGICRDITNIGRWGNGDVEVGITSLGELPYIMSLVSQSFERQMAGGATG
jgi:uncharacterized protein with ParB-like and HNH nuclease domain/predicted transport protein